MADVEGLEESRPIAPRRRRVAPSLEPKVGKNDGVIEIREKNPGQTEFGRPYYIILPNLAGQVPLSERRPGRTLGFILSGLARYAGRAVRLHKE